MTPWVTIAIGLVALLYAAVGHAGATGYTAVMALAGLPQEVIRPTALMLNLVVAAIGTVQFARAGHFRRRLFLPLAVGSVPCAAIGGAWKLATGAFEGLLATVLLVAAARIVVEAHAVGPRGPADGHWPLVVDIAAHLETKLAAIGCYRSQFPPEKAHVFPRVRSMAETVGMMAGCAAGELLAGSRMPLTTDPLGMLFPG